MGAQPLTVVHLVVLRQVACHDCGWLSALTDDQAQADGWAEAHDCRRLPGEMRAWRDSNSRPLHP